MGMIVNQEFMTDYVINPMAKRIADLEKKIDLVLDDNKFLIEQFDKVIENIKKVK